MAVFSRLLPSLVSAYGFQIACAAIFVPQASEKYYDLCGALGYLSTAYVSLYYPFLREKFILGKSVVPPPLTSFAPRQLLLTACLSIWSIRLGTFLAQRAIKAGGDSRFDEVKHKPAQFFFFWVAQATWVSLVGLPVWLANSAPPHLHPSLRLRDYASLAFVAGSFLFEVTADYQKSKWRSEKNKKLHNEDFISSGLWAISRHPNYLGEVGIWTGIWALSTPSLQIPYFSRITPWVALASPLFTYVLVRHVSGVPLLEKAGNKKFKENPKWKEYKRSVPIFWPWGPRN